MANRAFMIVFDTLQELDQPLVDMRIESGTKRDKHRRKEHGLDKSFGGLGIISATLFLWAGGLPFIKNHIFNTDAFLVLSRLEPSWSPWKHCFYNSHGIYSVMKKTMDDVCRVAKFLNFTVHTITER